MQFQALSRSDSEKIFIGVRNISAATVSAGAPVEWDVVSVTDGNSVSALRSGTLAGLFAGISDAAMTDSAYGRIQVYGFRTSAYVSAASAGNVPGTWLGAGFAGVLTDLTTSAAGVSGYHSVCLMETVAAAAGSSATAQYNVMIRAM